MIKIVKIQPPTPQTQPGADQATNAMAAVNAMWFGNTPVPQPPLLTGTFPSGTHSRPTSPPTPTMESVKPRKVTIRPDLIPALVPVVTDATPEIKGVKPNRSVPTPPKGMVTPEMKSQLVPELNIPRPKPLVKPLTIGPINGNQTAAEAPQSDKNRVVGQGDDLRIQSQNKAKATIPVLESQLPPVKTRSQSERLPDILEKALPQPGEKPVSAKRPTATPVETQVVKERQRGNNEPERVTPKDHQRRTKRLPHRPVISPDKVANQLENPRPAVPRRIAPDPALKEDTTVSRNDQPANKPASPVTQMAKTEPEAKVTPRGSTSSAPDSIPVKMGHRSGLFQEARETVPLPKFGKLNQALHVEKISRMILQLSSGTAKVTHFTVDSGTLGKIGVQFSHLDTREHVTIMVDNPSSKEFIDRLVPSIQETLAQKGFELSSLDVQINQQAARDSGPRTGHKKTKGRWTVAKESESASSETVEPQPVKLNYGYNTLEIIA